MPFTPTTPPTIDVSGPAVSKDLTVFHLHRLDISVDPNDDTKVVVNVHWSKGYVDNENKYIPVVRNVVALTGQDVLTSMGGTTTGNKSLYNEVREAIWGLLQSRELVPAGTVS